MSTSDRAPGPGGGDAIATTELPAGQPSGVTIEEIARLANQFFSAFPAAGLTPPPAPGFAQQPPLASAPLPRESDLRTLPATLTDGFSFALPLGLVDGADPAATGAAFLNAPAASSITQPPVSGAPVPRESDLRTLPATPTEGLPFALPLGLVGGPDLSATEPYFLALAGTPPAPQVAAAPPAATPPAASVPGIASAVEPEPAPDRGRPFETRLFDPYTIKRDFPILRERVHGRPLVWLDNAATTQKPQSVIDRISYYYEHENSNVHRAAHTLAARATDAFEAARDKVRRFLNAPSAKDIVFARGATEAINLVAKSWGRRNVDAGDEIVISWLEHHANIVPWQQLAAEKGARLRVIPVDDRGEVNLEEYEKLLGPRTRLVSVSQVSNALGTIVPVREMIEMAHRHGARILIDGAQAVSHLPVDVQALDCDFYCFSGHKIFAPTGIGALYGKSDVLAAMPPWQGGGNMIADVTFEKTTYQPPPGRFEAGTGSIADAVGLGAALDYVSAIGLDTIGRYEHELLEYATACLQTVPGLRLIGTAPEKAGVLSFVLDGVRTEDVGGMLDQEGIAVRSGHHCAQPILRRFGLESTVRASLAPYNTREDIDALVTALRRLQAGRPARGL
jgi:cysteine desulfurase/selenocysteine lyase